MSTPLWRQVLEGTYDPFASSFDRSRSSGGSFEGLQTDWRAFSLEEDAQRAAERRLVEDERAALEARGQEYVNLAGAEGRIQTAADVATAFGQPGIEPTGPAPAIEGIANVLDAAKSAVVGGLSGLMGWDIQSDDIDETRIGTSRFTRREDLIGDRNRLEVAWERALNGLFGGQSYGFGDFEALRYEQEDPRLQRVAKGAAAFALDVALDPLTYFSFGSSILGRIVASTGVRTASRKVAIETLQQAGDAAIRQQVERLGSRELAVRVSKATGKEFGELIIRSPSELADELLKIKPGDYLEAAADSWSFGNAAAYGSRGRTGLYDRLVDTVGTDIADNVWKTFDPDIRGGARFRVPFKRTVSEETGLRLPTVFQFPGSQPGRGFDKLGMGNVVRRMNEARLKMRAGPFKFLEHVSGGRGRSWTKIHQAARNGDGEAIEAYAVYHHLLAFDDAARRQAAYYDQIASAGMQAIARKLSAAGEQGMDQDEVLDFVRELYFKRGRSDLPQVSSPSHVVAVDIADHLFEMTDNVHQLAVDLYGEDAARKMEDYATRMLTEEGFQELVDRYGRLEGRRGRLAESDGRLISSYPKKMDIGPDGKLIVTEWMTPDEITKATTQKLFISDPVEAVGEYMIMMRRELMRDWSLKQLDEMGLLKSIGEDVIRQPTIRKIQSEVHSRLVKVRTTLDRIQKGERVQETDLIQAEAESAAAKTISTAGQLAEVEQGVWRSQDGLVEVRRNRSGGYSASVGGQPVLRPNISQIQAEELVPELQGPVREVNWDQVRSGFYDEQGNRIPARQVRMEGVDDPRWITTAEPAPRRRPGATPAPEPDDSREISGTWEPWLRSGSEIDLEYVHKVLRHRVAVYENGGRSVSPRAYQIHKRDLDILEEMHPHLRNMQYDAPIPQSASLPEQKYRVEIGPDGSWRIVENLQPGEAGVTIVSRSNDIFELSNGRQIQITKSGGFWEAAEYDPTTATVSLIARGTNKKSLTEDIIEMYSGGRTPTPTPEPTPTVTGIPALRSKAEIAEDIQSAKISWTKNGKIHTASYQDFEMNILPVEEGSREAARGEKYIQEVIYPNGEVRRKASNAKKLDDAKRLTVDFLNWDIQNYERGFRDAAVRDAYDVWPGMSLVRGEPGQYQVVDLGDGTTVFINRNMDGWFASRKGDDFGKSIPGLYEAREDLLADLDELFPGISRVFDGETATPTPVGAAPTRLPAASVDEWLADKVEFPELRRVALNTDEAVAFYGDFNIIVRKVVSDSGDRYSVSILSAAQNTGERAGIEIAASSDEEAFEIASSLFRDFYQFSVDEGYVDPLWALDASISRSGVRLDYLETVRGKWEQIEGGWRAGPWNGYTFEIMSRPGDSNWTARITGPDGEVISENQYKTGFQEMKGWIDRDFSGYLDTLELGEIADIVGVARRRADTASVSLGDTPVQVPSAADVPPWEQTTEQFVASGRTLYHGTPQEFDFFDSMDATYRGRGQRPSAARGRFYFTDDPDIAGDFRQNVTGIDPESWLSRTMYDLEDLDDPEIFRLFSDDVQSNLNRLGGRLQIMDDAGDWVNFDLDDLTPEIVLSETPMRSVSDRGQVIQTRVFGRELDLTGDLSDAPEGLVEALRLDGLLDEASRAAKMSPGYQFRHERSFDNTSAWMRQNGYGRALVPDATDSGGRSYIGLEEYIEYGRDPQQLHSQLLEGRTVVPPTPEPEPIVPGLRREYAGKYRYTRETGEQFEIEQVRPEGKARVWRVTDPEGVEIGDFSRREDAVAYLEGRDPQPPRQVLPPETRALVQDFNRALGEFNQVRQDITDMADRLRAQDYTPEELASLQASLDDVYDYMANVIEILSFDHPEVARRLVARVPDVGEFIVGSDVSSLLSDIIEDTAARAPQGGIQEGFGIAQAVGGAGQTLTPPVPRSDFIDRDEAAYWAARHANKIREPRARIVRDEVWERNRTELIQRLQEDNTWLEAALSDGMLLRNVAEEDFETWVERVTSFLDGVDPSIDPFDSAIDKSRYARAAREAGVERFSLSGMDPVVSSIINSQDLFGPEMLAESIKRHFALSRDMEGADGFYQNFWRPYYTASKSWMTQGRGYGYTGRNIVGSMYNAWIADVRARHFKHSAALLTARREARKSADEILERRGVQEGESTVEAWERIFDTELRRYLKEGVGGFAGLRDNVAELVADAYQTFTDRNYGGRTARSRTWGDILDRGSFDSPVYGAGDVGRRQAELFPGRSIDELTRAQRIANTTIDNPWMRHVTRVNESVEDYLRFAAFLRGVDTYGLDDGGFAAGTWVVGTQFDYANLSDFERRVMKNIVPFYTWTRYNVPLQVRSLWMQPGKVSRLLRFHEEVVKAWTGESKEDESSLPEWLRRRGGWMTTMSTPLTDPESALGEIFGFKEDPIAAFIESPLSDLGMLFNATLNPLQILNTDEIINNLNPIVGRTAYEMFTGRSYVSGRELDTDAVAPRWAQPWALARGRRNEDGELVFSQKWAQLFRNVLPPFAQAERLFAPLLGDERQRRRWLTTVGSQVLAVPLYTVDPNQQAFALNSFAQGIQEALREGIINYEDKRDVATRLMDRGYTPEQIAQLGLSTIDPATLNWDELSRARRDVATENQITSFLDTMPESVAEQFIFRRGFRGQEGVAAVEAWRNRQPIDELGALFLPELNSTFANWFSRLSESEKLGFVFEYGYGPYRGAQAVQQWSSRGGLPNIPAGMGSADFLS